ncbi:MAG: hypothetical protein H6742_03165 [Alphaproteobacteria bacterium]|nr:hypothetical protein [Alphaproteobacteria bacterium]
MTQTAPLPEPVERIQIALAPLEFVLAPEPLPADLPALGWSFRDGRMIVDHLVLVDGETQDLRQVHAAAVEWANGRFSTPRAMRVRCPHVLTVGLYAGPVDPELVDWIQRQPRRSFWGGETRHVAALSAGGDVHVQHAFGRVNRQSVALTGRDELLAVVARAWRGG